MKKTYLSVGLAILSMATAVCMLTGCVTTPVDVLSIACKKEQTHEIERCAKAIAEIYKDVYQKQALTLLEDPSIDESTKSSVRKAESIATDAVLELNKANSTYIRTVDVLSRKPDPTASDTEQALQQQAMVRDLVALVAPKINSLIAKTGGAK